MFARIFASWCCWSAPILNDGAFIQCRPLGELLDGSQVIVVNLELVVYLDPFLGIFHQGQRVYIITGKQCKPSIKYNILETHYTKERENVIEFWLVIGVRSFQADRENKEWKGTCSSRMNQKQATDFTLCRSWNFSINVFACNAQQDNVPPKKKRVRNQICI